MNILGNVLKGSVGIGFWLACIVAQWGWILKAEDGVSGLLLERSATGLNLRLREDIQARHPVLEPRYRVHRSFDLQTWEPLGELSRAKMGSRVLEVEPRTGVIGFFQIAQLPLDLEGAELSGLDLSLLNLAGANLSGADLRYADLSGADLRDANLSKADLRGADLRATRLEGVDIRDASLRGANIIGLNLLGLDSGLESVPGVVQLIPEAQLGFEIGDVFDRAAPLPPTASLGRSGRSNLGFAVGGANDIGNFRQNIENEFLPLSTDVTYEGLFLGYFFDAGLTAPCEELFCPSYAQAVSPDPISGQEERYLAVGLNSGIKESDFVRKQLNLTVVLDVSRSMDSPFNRFFHDGAGIQHELTDEESTLLKIDIAIEAVTVLFDHLDPEDRIGVVSFNSEARLVQPLAKVENLNMEDVRRRVTRLRAFSGTNMAAGMKGATGQYSSLLEIDPTVSENRIIFVTDAMPNLGETSREGLIGMIEDNAAKRIYSTVIGVGVDFNTDLIESITKNRGANYHSVHSPAQFIERMDEGFDFMVTPLAFDLRLALEGEGWSIEKVYGSPEADEATGEVFRVNTLFPSRTQDGQTRGGLILLKLSRNPEVENSELKLSTSYENRVGEQFTNETMLEFVNPDGQHFDNSGIRKGILLARYVNFLKNWILDERSSYHEDRPIIRPLVHPHWGIPTPPPWLKINLGEWERRPMPLFVDHSYRELFGQFKEYFAAEIEAIGDEDLKQELKVLERLASDPVVIGEDVLRLP
ncbi:MAG: Serine/threonine-protein kinase B [Verrucomicrobia subdivision 3 bacterium]|nr:Serine/threonine-protein kinase B [Limisphaerales bacterium]MCS1415473.1 Serine/threonine-protein kinase B [Limisphaerales bacterium]